jgi:hypothetical protein
MHSDSAAAAKLEIVIHFENLDFNWSVAEEEI